MSSAKRRRTVLTLARIAAALRKAWVREAGEGSGSKQLASKTRSTSAEGCGSIAASEAWASTPSSVNGASSADPMFQGVPIARRPDPSGTTATSSSARRRGWGWHSSPKVLLPAPDWPVKRAACCAAKATPWTSRPPES